VEWGGGSREEMVGAIYAMYNISLFEIVTRDPPCKMIIF
jgi:hypothetical protein